MDLRETKLNSKSIPLRIDSKGRITLPWKLRKKLGVEGGDVLFLVKFNKGTIVLYTMDRLVEDRRTREGGT